MNKEQRTSVVTQTEEFDRSICMSFFGNYRTSVKRIEKRFGVDTAYKVQSAIIDYGLYGVRPTDEDILILVSETVFDVIDKSQAKRARNFNGEDLEMSKKIIQSHLDRPDLSQDKLSQLLHTSKGKVNKTLKKYRNGEYKCILNFDTNNVNDSDYDYDGDYDSTDRDCRDRQTGHALETASPTTESATPTPPTQTELTYEEYTSVMDIWERRTGKSPNDIADELNLDRGLVNKAIDEYKKNKFIRKDKPKRIIEEIPLLNGGYLNRTKEELFNEATNNGKSLVEDVAWKELENGYIMFGIAPITVKQLTNEFKQKLKDLNDATVLQRAIR